jgi:hypothetical protein
MLVSQGYRHGGLPPSVIAPAAFWHPESRILWDYCGRVVKWSRKSQRGRFGRTNEMMCCEFCSGESIYYPPRFSNQRTTMVSLLTANGF